MQENDLVANDGARSNTETLSPNTTIPARSAVSGQEQGVKGKEIGGRGPKRDTNSLKKPPEPVTSDRAEAGRFPARATALGRIQGHVVNLRCR